MNNSDKPSVPRRSALMGEARAAIDLLRMLGPLAAAKLQPATSKNDLLVMLIPGFGSSERYMKPLSRYLSQRGYRVEDWGLGKNLAGIDLRHNLSDLSDRWQVSPRQPYRGEASVPYLVDRLFDRVGQRHEQTGLPVALVGWSLGGFLAREAARDLPNVVERVVTMGSPVVGGPKYTAAASIFSRRGMDLDWIEREIHKRESRPINQPITVIYSKSDAIVDWRAAIDHYSKNVTHIELDAAHLGMGFNPTIWRHILAALERPTADSAQN